MKEAYFAGGCFWCISPVFKELNGVLNVECGYAGTDNIIVNYETVKSQTTDYKETINVSYDEEKINFEQLVKVFLNNVDPFNGDGQYIDFGTSYQLAIFVNNQFEREIAEKMIKQIEEKYQKKSYIKVINLPNYVKAEDYHQDYAEKNPKAFLKEIVESGRSTQINIKKGSKILFIGDSVTAYGKDLNEFASIGKSYAKMLADKWQDDAKCFNTSVSGRKVKDVLDHFDEEVLRVNPDYAFVLIGVNDTWHGFPHANNPLPKFKSEYSLLLKKIKEQTNAKIIVMEPFIIGTVPEISIMRADLNARIEIIKEIVVENNLSYITFKKAFENYLTKDNEQVYSHEGIHPTMEGYKVMYEVIKNLVHFV